MTVSCKIYCSVVKARGVLLVDGPHLGQTRGVEQGAKFIVEVLGPIQSLLGQVRVGSLETATMLLLLL